MSFRYPVAIKCARVKSDADVANFLDEVKSMLEINDYHENIVNLQGITYKTSIRETLSLGVNFDNIFISLDNVLSIFLAYQCIFNRTTFYISVLASS